MTPVRDAGIVDFWSSANWSFNSISQIDKQGM